MQQVELKLEMTDPAETQEQEVQGQGKILKEKNRKAKWYQYGLVQSSKLLYKIYAKFYANKQKTKMAMSDAQLMHAENGPR